MPYHQLDADKHSDANDTAPTLPSKATTTKTIDNRCARVSSPGRKDSRKPGITTMMSSPIDHGFLDEDTTLTLNIIIAPQSNSDVTALDNYRPLGLQHRHV
ncbi:hypothetical protein B0O80DRAFT_502898 [Mortierella sp. GBAus27b]|nr:hypothetical protein B0O80DRAFT_502898 [Mortierella sp. GBAus27b]